MQAQCIEAHPAQIVEVRASGVKCESSGQRRWISGFRIQLSRAAAFAHGISKNIAVVPLFGIPVEREGIGNRSRY
jgi:hypothetical protein